MSQIMNAPPDLAAAQIRRLYVLWKAGAGLRQDDIERLAMAAGLALSRNALRELGRRSDRGASIAGHEFEAILRAWTDEQQDQRRSISATTPE